MDKTNTINEEKCLDRVKTETFTEEAVTKQAAIADFLFYTWVVKMIWSFVRESLSEFLANGC